MKNKKLKILSALVSLCVLSTISVGATDFSDGTEKPTTLTDTTPNAEKSDDFQTDVDGASETFDSGEEIFSGEENEEFSSEIPEADMGEVQIAGALEDSVSAYSYNTNVNAKIESDPSVKTTCTIYKGKNLESQDYITGADPVSSYLITCSNGYLMRVQAGALEGKLLIEYYDASYNIQKTMTVNLELPVFGAFYESNDNYYVLTGAKNLNENNEQEVYHITKYTKNWQSLGSCGVFGGNTTTPFRAGSARMIMYGKYLYVRTCHEMYTSSDTYRHQSNLSFTVDTSSMKIFDLYDRPVWGVLTGYVSHSFNQFLRVDNGTFLGLDQGDAYPRALVLSKNTVDINTGHLGTGLSFHELFSFPGQIGANYTGASVGGFEFSDSSYLAAGNYDSDDSGSPRNVFVVSASKSGISPVVRYFTNYAGTEDSASTPHLIKTGNNSFILMWSSRGYVYYTALNGNGQQVGSTYKMAGNLSDCVPSIINGKLIWYTWYNAENTFYSINLSDLSENHATRIVNGHKFEYGTKVENGLITRTCHICGFQDYAAVPVSIRVIRKEDDLRYYMSDSYGMELNKNVELYWNYEYGDTSAASERLSDFLVDSSDSSVLEVKQTAKTNATITGLKPGKAIITIRPKNNLDVVFRSEIYVNILDEKFFSVSVSPNSYTYDGNEHKPQIRLTFWKNDKNLKEGTDYKASYEGDFVNAGKGIIKLTGIGDYIGAITKEFSIYSKKLTYGSTKITIPDVSYDGSPKEPEVTVVCDNRKLTRNKDFSVSYEQNAEHGYASVAITGTGNYDGTLLGSFYIYPQKLDNCSIILSSDSFNYDGAEKKPDVVVKFGNKQLILNEDFYLTYYNNIEPGTATVKITASGNYSGSIEKKYKILPVDIGDCEITLSDESYIYDGTEKEPYVEVRHGTELLYEDFDYYIASYSNNINAGIATVTINGYDYYSGSVTRTFEIKRAPASISAEDLILNQSTRKQTVITEAVTDGNITLTSSVPDIVKVSGTKIIPAAPGKAVITITAEQGQNYEAAEKTITVTVRPLTVTKLSLKSKAKGQVTVSWTQAKSISGYQIYYSPYSNMKGAKYITAKSTAKSATLKKLTSKKKYYIRIRTYKTVDGKKYYSNWSAVKSVSVK